LLLYFATSSESGAPKTSNFLTSSEDRDIDMSYAVAKNPKSNV